MDPKQVIAQLRSSTNVSTLPSSGDIDAAIKAARAMGQEGLVAEIQNAKQEAVERIKTEEAAKAKANSNLKDVDNRDPLIKADEYFANKDVIKSSETAQRMVEEKPVSTADYLHSVQHHCSSEAEIKEAKLRLELKAKRMKILTETEKKGLSSPNKKDAIDLQKINKNISKLNKIEAYRQCVVEKIGKDHTEKSLLEAARQKEAEIKAHVKAELNNKITDMNAMEAAFIAGYTQKFEQQGNKKSNSNKYKSETPVEYVDYSKPRVPSATPTVGKSKGKGMSA